MIAGFVEFRLFRKRIHQLFLRVRQDEVGQLRAVADDHGRVVVRAAEKHHSVADMRVREPMQRVEHHLVPVYIGDRREVYDG